MWFLWAMFWGLVIFYFIIWNWRKYYFLICVGLSVIACFICSFIQECCPLSIMQGIGALTFIAIGFWIKDHNLPIWFLGICIISWGLSVVFFPLNMSSNSYAFYPINILAGLGGTYCIYLLAYGINKLKFSRRIWITLGEISLPILCFHEIIPLTDIFNSIRIRLIQYLVINDIYWIIIQYLCVISIAYICNKLPYLKKIYIR